MGPGVLLVLARPSLVHSHRLSTAFSPTAPAPCLTDHDGFMFDAELGQDSLVLSRSTHPAYIRQARRQGTLERLTRGAYWLPENKERHELARLRAVSHLRAVSVMLGSDHTFCRASAALLWDLPLWSIPTAAHVIQRWTTGAGGRRDTIRHRETCPDEDTTVLHGLRATTLERTVVDCARTLPAADGLALVDAALGLGVERSRLAQACVRGARGVVRARAVIEEADGGAASPGESITRLHLLRHGLPRPETQIRIRTRRGTFYGDLGWRCGRVLVEFDGRIKYTRLAQGDPAEVVYQEKLRQEAIEELGWRVARVAAADLRDGPGLARRIGFLLPEFTSTDRPGLG